MDKMFVRVPVAIKAKVTEDLKLKIIGDVQNTIKTINLDIEHFEFQAKKALSQAASDLSVLPSLREQIEMERNKINAAKANLNALKPWRSVRRSVTVHLNVLSRSP